MTRCAWVLAACMAACGGGGTPPPPEVDSGPPPCDPDAPNTICTIAGNGDQGFGGDGGPATAATLYVPQDMAIAPDGNLWIDDFNNYMIRAVLPDGTIHTVVGIGEVGDSPTPGMTTTPALQASFNHTSDLFFFNGYLYLASWHNSRIKRVNLATMEVENFAGLGRRTYYLTYDNQGNLYLADSENNRIRKVDAAGTITTFAGTGVAGYAGDGGPATAAQISRPIDIEAGDDGTLYFTDVGNSCVRKIDPAGIISTVAGQCNPDPTLSHGFSGDGGPPTAALLDRPYGVHIAGKKLYIADSYNNRIRVVNLP